MRMRYAAIHDARFGHSRLRQAGEQAGWAGTRDGRSRQGNRRRQKWGAEAPGAEARRSQVPFVGVDCRSMAQAGKGWFGLGFGGDKAGTNGRSQSPENWVCNEERAN